MADHRELGRTQRRKQEQFSRNPRALTTASKRQKELESERAERDALAQVVAKAVCAELDKRERSHSRLMPSIGDF